MTTTESLPAPDGPGVEAPCPVCIEADHRGCFGPALRPARTHCRGCHRSWGNAEVPPGPRCTRGGIRQVHCPACHAQFRNPQAFDAHLTAAGCRPPQTVRRGDGRPRFTYRDTRWGPLWALASYGPRPAHWDAA